MAATDQATRDALSTLADLVRADSGASFAAQSVLLYAWNSSRSIHQFANLSGKNKAAAIKILDRAWAIDPDVIESIVPEIRQWQDETRTR